MARLSSYQKLKQQNFQLIYENQLLRDNLAYAKSQLTYDSLTGIFCEQGFYEHTEHLIADLTRNKRSLALAYADINDFKTINDRFGHAEGDRAIIHVARILKRTIRNIDIVARLHGDEFAFALPDVTTAASIHIFLRRINDAIASNPFHAAGQQVTLSVAIAAIPYDKDLSLKKNLGNADQQMLLQKPHRHR